MAWSKRLLPAAPASHTGTTSNSHGPSPTQLFASAAGEAVQDGPGKQWRTARASSGGQPGKQWRTARGLGLGLTGETWMTVLALAWPREPVNRRTLSLPLSANFK